MPLSKLRGISAFKSDYQKLVTSPPALGNPTPLKKNMYHYQAMACYDICLGHDSAPSSHTIVALLVVTEEANSIMINIMYAS